MSENKIIDLCNSLISALKAESYEISARNLENLERYAAQKDVLIKEMQNPANRALWNSNAEDAAELQSLIKQIIEANDSNEKALLGMKDTIVSEMSGLQKTKAASKAYTAK